MAIEYTGLAHVAFFAKDYEKMFDFYVNKLGGMYAYHMTRCCWPEGEPFWPEGTKADDVWLTYICFGNQFIELFNEGYSGSNTYAAHSQAHFALEIGNMICMIERLTREGVKVYEYPEGPELSESIIARPLDSSNCRSCYVRDPEGNWIELVQYTPESYQLVCG